MENPDDQFQRRAIVGDRHFILADVNQPDHWALAGPVVLATDADGNRRFGPARTITTAQLSAWAAGQNLRLQIADKFPLVRRDISASIIEPAY
ncbi:hypothetical protein KEF85_05650 [Methylomonas paludis]|uniref:Uncharacterized protein n=1 Tax=Methylomonas paludis TaxID=1173101 RepID=A0A975RAA3_9GAMM|nr:hypothetical protein [Methylomonas paludis]QWF71942.1 hypothetical protein KEF85_05650 [Methylomonas paludis]